jgi:hypothetical protein
MAGFRFVPARCITEHTRMGLYGGCMVVGRNGAVSEQTPFVHDSSYGQGKQLIQ